VTSSVRRTPTRACQSALRVGSARGRHRTRGHFSNVKWEAPVGRADLTYPQLTQPRAAIRAPRADDQRGAGFLMRVALLIAQNNQRPPARSVLSRETDYYGGSWRPTRQREPAAPSTARARPRKSALHFATLERQACGNPAAPCGYLKMSPG